MRVHLSLKEACERAIKDENSKIDIEQWCYSLNVLIEAVKSGVISQTRDHKKQNAHWWSQLYMHAYKLDMGSVDKEYILAYVRAAESFGLIGSGS